MICVYAGWEEGWFKISSFINFILGLFTRKDIYLGGRERAALLTFLTDSSL